MISEQQTSCSIGCGSKEYDVKPFSGTENCESGHCCNVGSNESSAVENRVLKKDKSEDWNVEIGSLIDDDAPLPKHVDPVNGQCHQVIDTEEKPVSSSSGDNKSNKTRSGHRPKLESHLSWRDALQKARNMPDPWEKFHIDDSCPTEVAIRHRFNALKNSWVKDEVRIKMESLVSFG